MKYAGFKNGCLRRLVPAAMLLPLVYVPLSMQLEALVLGILSVCVLLMAMEWQNFLPAKSKPFWLYHVTSTFCMLFLLFLGDKGDSVILVGLFVLALATVCAYAFSGIWQAWGVLYTSSLIWSVLLLQNAFSFNLLCDVLLTVFYTAIISDTAGMLCGRLIKTPPICASISPNKTWLGTVGAFLLPVIIVPFLIKMLGGYYAEPYEIAVLSALCIFGDLLESYIKRKAGIKDAGKMLMGHGGLFDRVDGMMFVLYGAVIVLLWGL